MNEIITNKESKNIEFKKSVGEWKEIVETVSAFSNTRGGEILVGMLNSGKVIGVKVGKDTIEDLTNKIVSNTDPKVYPKILVEKTKGKSIIVIEVKESAEKLVLAFGRPYKRVGKSTVRMSKDEYENTILEKHKEKLQFDTQICKSATWKDLDKEKVKQFLRTAKAERNFDVNPNVSLKEAIERLGLVGADKLLNTALLLFGKNPQKFFPQVRIRCARFKGTEGLDYIDMKILEGTIPELRENAMKFVMQYIKHGVFFDANRRYDKWEYPLRAVEEALNNALGHRDYFSNAEIHLSIYDDRLEVWNPGELLPPLRPEDLKKEHKSIPRNKFLADKLFLIKYIEEWGRGTNRIVDEMKENKLSEPEFKNYSGGFAVTLIGPGKSFEEKIEKEKLHILEINERQKKAIEYLKTNDVISTKVYMKLNKVSDKTAFLELNNLLIKNILIKEGKGRTTIYKLKR
jgi:ATP-dependent DNA helicase RecG